MDVTAPIFTKITTKQYSYVNTEFTEQYPNQTKISENICKYYLRAYVKYGRHCANFHENYKQTIELYEHRVYRTVSKSDEDF
jgi:hypothetical protein